VDVARSNAGRKVLDNFIMHLTTKKKMCLVVFRICLLDLCFNKQTKMRWLFLEFVVCFCFYNQTKTAFGCFSKLFVVSNKNCWLCVRNLLLICVLTINHIKI
jgi:hypothetical protein